MAVKKQEAAVQDTAEKTEAVQENAQAEKDTVIVHLFKDGHRYSEPVFVGVNGETYLIQRVEIAGAFLVLFCAAKENIPRPAKHFPERPKLFLLDPFAIFVFFHGVDLKYSPL